MEELGRHPDGAVKVNPSRWLFHVFLPAIVLIVVASCGDGDEPTPDNGPELRVAQLRAVEELRIDGAVEDLVLIGGFVVLDSGVMAFSQPQDHLIRLYSASGELIGSLGREGEGPGEFLSAFQLGRLRDSLTVYDDDLNRFTVFGPDGTLGRVVRVADRARPGPEVEELPRWGFTEEMYLTLDGIVARVIGVEPLPDGSKRRESVVVRMDETGLAETVLGRFVEEIPGVRLSVGNVTHSATFPYPNLLRYHLALDGSRYVVAEAAVHGPDVGTYSVIAIGAQGDTAFFRRYPFDAVPVSKQYADSVIAARSVGIEERSPRLAATYRRRAALPPILPPVLSVWNGRDGTVWVGLRSSAPGREYLILDPTGEPLGRVTLPPGASIRVVDQEHAWTVETDDFGIQSVVRYRIVP